MATTIKLKNSVTTTAAPSTLVQGEVAVNVTDKKVWVGNAASSPVQILGAGATVSGTDATFTGNVTLGDASGDALTINSSAVSIPNGLNFDSNTLVIDATNNRVGVGTASPSKKITVEVADGDGIDIVQSGSSRLNLSTSLATLTSTIEATNYYLNIESAGTARGEILFSTSASSSTGTERMRITSTGNVGIGTSSPSYGGWNKALSLIGSTNAGVEVGSAQTTADATVGGFDVIQTSNTTNKEIAQIAGASTGATAGNTGGYLKFYTKPDAGSIAERMRLDSSGNLGLGVTPSAWLGQWTTFNMAGGASIASRSSNTEELYLSANAYNDGSWKYIASNFATQYYQDAGTHVWRTAPSGTAGNAITFTQAMTLDASGNLGIGTTSPSTYASTTSPALVVVSAATPSNLANGTICAWDGTTGGAANVGGIYTLGGNDGVTAARAFASIKGGKENATSGNYASYLAFGTRANGGSITERMRIDSSGRLLVGVTSPVGSTFSTIQYDAGTYNGLGLNQSANTSGGRFMLFASQGTQCGVIDRVGTTSAVVYTATSDRRLKENIVDAPSALEHINSVKVRSYDWIDSKHHVKYGVIAQEFIDVEPDAVVKGDDTDQIEKTWSVDTSVLVPAMIKAIQELKEEVDSLKAKLNK